MPSFGSRAQPAVALRGASWGAAFLAAAVGLTLSGCDNPACVFGPGNCQGGAGGGLLGAEAFAPSPGRWIEDAAPAVRSVSPTGAGASTTTPVAVLFSESLAESTTLTAFRLERFDDFGSLPIVATPSLVGDGRMLVLVPATALSANTTYRVVYSQSANARDLTGQALSTTPGAVVASFTTGGTNPAAPRVVATYPEDGDDDQSARGEIVVLFDRPMVSTDFAGNGWAVTVDGVPPALDPAPSPLSLGGQLGLPDTRIWRWRSVDGAGEPADLGADVTVSLSLSPAGAKLNATSGGELAPTVVEFATAPFSAPSGARFLSAPDDAIGIDNLTAGHPEALQLEVDLEGAVGGDRLTVFVFGEDFSDPPVLVAVQRTIQLPGGVGDTAVFDLGDLNLTTGGSPLEARFADGELRFALRLARGSVVSPISLFDVDDSAPGVQHPVLDTVRPTLVDLIAPGGGGDLYRSDLEGLTLVGRASETLRRVAVSTTLGDNGPDPDVVGSDENGWFVARPVPLGAIAAAELPLDYEFQLFDRALNSSALAPGLYRQLGAVGGGALVPGESLVVEVFDELSLAPVVGARVFTHGDLGDGSAYPPIADATTDADGLTTVAAHDAPAVGTILSVDALGYDRITFHGVEAARLSIPLRRSPAPTAGVGGTVTTSSVFGSLTLPTSDLALDDTRRAPSAAPTAPAGACVGSPFGGQGVACPYGPLPIQPVRIGARSFLAGDFDLAEPNFSAASLIKAFEFAPVRPPVAALGVGADAIGVERLLNESGVPVDDLPVALPPTPVSGLLATGVDLDNLVDDPAFGAEPRLVVETTLPGQIAPLTVGLGIAYPSGAGAWTGRAAYPGAIFAFSAEIGDPSELLRVAAEVRDTAGASSRVSLNLSQLPSFGNTLFLPPVPVPTAPLAAEVLAAKAFEVIVPNTLLDGIFAGSPNGAGLYRVELVDDGGRGWTVWRPDVADGASALVRLFVPDLSQSGGSALAAGDLTLRAGVVAYAGFDPAAFQFSDLERRAAFRSQSAPIAVTVP